MNPESFDTIRRTADGSPIVSLLVDPTMPEGSGFLSLVDRGANGRRIKITKAAAVPGAIAVTDDGPDLTRADLGQTAAGTSFWRRLFGPLLGLGLDVASKGEDRPTEFAATLIVSSIYDTLWKGSDALRTTISAILADEAVLDKSAAIDLALSQFHRYVMATFDAMPTSKGALDAGRVGKIAEAARAEPAPELAAKAGRVISRSNRATLDEARTALDAARDLVARLLSIADGLDPDAENKGSEEDMVMKLDAAAIKRLADAAAVNAVAAAKAANPALTATDAAAIAAHAAVEVHKAAVAGAPQPGLPADTLATQLAQGGGAPGAPDPLAEFTRVLGALGEAVAKIDRTLHGVAATPAAGDKAATPAEPGLVDVVAAQSSALTALGTRVSKIAATPTAPRGGPVDSSPSSAPTDSTTFKGSGLGGL